MPAIDAARLLRDLRDLARIGAWKTGVHRPTYSADDMTARHWFADRLSEAGLQPEIDGIGNVIGRTSAPGPKLLLGSHLETQPHAGWLDGALGVIYGLEIARVLGPTLGHAIEVGAWADEAISAISSAAVHSCAGSTGQKSRAPSTAATGENWRTRWPGRGWRDGSARGSIRRATAAIWRRISSRATSSTPPALASAWSPASSASGNT
jgi:hypothetical protein